MKCLEEWTDEHDAPDGMLVHLCVHRLSTWCGWNRIWDGGSWPIVDESVAVTCLECIGRAEREDPRFLPRAVTPKSSFGPTTLTFQWNER